MSWKGSVQPCIIFLMHTLIYWIEGGTQDLSGYLPSWSCLLVAQQLCLEGRLVLFSPGVGGARWRYPDAPQQGKGCTCVLPSELLPRFAWNLVRWEALKQAQGQWVRHPLVSRIFLGLCVIRNPVAWRCFFQRAEQAWSTWKLSINLVWCLMNFGELCVGNICAMFFSGSWFCGLNSNWWSLQEPTFSFGRGQNMDRTLVLKIQN